MKSLFNIKHLPVPVVLALLLITSGWANAQGTKPDCYVLSAGIDNYLQVNDLKGCISDVRNTVAAFESQQGKVFGSVRAQTLVDAEATHDRILNKMKDLSRAGKAGDFVVIFLSGHGARTANNQSWYFLPQDYRSENHAGTALTDRQILDAADVLVMQGKKVFVIVDACFAGQLNASAQPYLAKYRNPQGGGMVLMLSSSASQLSNALGQYSAFAKAFADSMNAGDLNRDGRITLTEVRRYSYDRTHSLMKQHGQTAKQDSEFAWSPSISENMPLALTKQVASNTTTQPPATKPPVSQPTTKPQPTVPQPTTQTVRVWSGSESLAGFGRLAFHLHSGNRVVMQDTAGTTEGTWQQNGNVVTLTFANGRVVYTGTLQGNRISGQAQNDRTSWTFNVASNAQ